MGAALDSMRADSGARLTALAEIFPDRLEYAKRALQSQLGSQFEVPDAHCFDGFDGYRKLLSTDIDVVLLCTTPHFRPAHMAAAVEAGKHVFCEKPVAVDAPGVRSVLESSRKAKEKGLSVVSGLCWRYDFGVRETIKRIKDGAIGDIVAMHENYLTGPLWHRGRKPEWSEMEYQIRNWYYFTWLSGDHNVEQHIHSLDKSLWLMNDKPPAKCVGLGGRQARTSADYGHIYDHFAVYYEWENGVKCFAFTRQMPNNFNETDDFIYGTKGKAVVLKNEITSGNNQWKYEGPTPVMYVQEHKELMDGIRKGEPINNGEYMSYSTMMAIMGRMACYTGQEVSWERAMASTEKLGPERYEWGDVKIPEVAIPGTTPLV